MMNGRRLAHYEVIERIGAGGMGEVYRARDARLGREVALKLLPPIFSEDEERLGRFKREAKLLASLNHANIATLHGLEEADGQPFLVMELVEGDDLAQRLARGAIPIKESLKIIRDVADALQTAHAQGIVHRDLKPANIKVTPEGRVKVLDFGLAKAYESDPSKRDLTQSPTIATGLGTMGGVILGTAAYMSPEQARGKTVDKLTDVWALGCVLYEMLTGQTAFPGETVSDTIAKILEREPDWPAIPADTPPGVQRLLHRCLEKDKTLRLQDVGEIRIEAQASLSGTSQVWTAAAAESSASPARRSRRGAALAWTVAALSIVAAGVMGALALRPAGEPPRIVRSTIPQPEGARFVSVGDYAGPVVISPDGRRIAFVANDKNLQPVLWVRDLDAVDARALPGTEGATFPFWSPDGQTVGYFNEGRLMRVEVSGGLPITVCDAPNGRGGSWGAKDIIVFAPGYQTGIYSVPATGGTPAAITTIDSTMHSTHRWPYFMPDGEHFIYLAVHHDVSKSEYYGLYFSSLDGSINKRVLSTGTSAVYASGHLLYVRENTLMAVPFDPAKGEMTGAPVTMIDKVQNDPTTWRSALSVSDDGILAYHQGTGNQDLGTRLTIIDRSGKELSSVDDAGAYYLLSVSPDGKTVAYSGALEGQPLTGGGGLTIFLYDLERGVKTRLSFQQGSSLAPQWSPDGKRVAYGTTYARSRGINNSIVIAQADGGGEELALETPPTDNVWVSDWTRDGRYIIYSVGDFVGARAEVWALPTTGNRKPFPLIASDRPDDGDMGVVSPDGRWIAYVASQASGNAIYVSPFTPPTSAGGDPNDHRTFAKWQVSNEGDSGTSPLWSDTGEELFFIKADGTIRSVEVDGRGDTFRAGRVHLLCRTDPWNFGHVGYDVMPGSQSFIVNVFSNNATPPIVLVQNWTLELKR